MATSVKNKIRIGTFFLFFLLTLIGAAGIYYTVKVKKDAKSILQNNYESLAYCHTMQQQLDSFQSNHGHSLQKFEEALQSEAKNVTEPTEGGSVKSLKIYFDRIKNGDTSDITINTVRSELQNILSANMRAIQNKNDAAEKTAENALTIFIVLATLIFLISFTFTLNFPSVVSTPIKQIQEAIKQINNKNYRHRIHIDNKDEFGQLANAFNEMTERLEYFESSNLNKLLFEKSRAEAVINSLKDASIGIDKNNIILFANYQALQLLGLKSAQIVGQKVENVSRQNDLFNFLINNDSNTPFKIVVENHENYFTKETLEITHDENHSKVIVLKNITSFKELDVAKTNFIATISHELKTPLASSDFSLKLLSDERISSLSEEQKELINNLKQDNQRMLRILSELLNMSQIEAGKIQLNTQYVSPADIVTGALQTVYTSAKEKNIHLTDKSEDNLPVIKADAEKTTWVLNNFLTNAIKYSANDSAVEIAATRRDNAIIFSVKDYGPGIDKKYQNRLFDQYFQVPGSKEKGSGLGLAISKDFIKAQGGKIWVDSEIGQGSVFSFLLPIE